MRCTLSLAVTSELLLDQRKEGNDPEEVQDRRTELWNSTKSLLLGIITTFKICTDMGERIHFEKLDLLSLEEKD